jgi:hypothetical protein
MNDLWRVGPYGCDLRRQESWLSNRRRRTLAFMTAQSGSEPNLLGNDPDLCAVWHGQGGECRQEQAKGGAGTRYSLRLTESSPAERTSRSACEADGCRWCCRDDDPAHFVKLPGGSFVQVRECSRQRAPGRWNLADPHPKSEISINNLAPAELRETGVGAALTRARYGNPI